MTEVKEEMHIFLKREEDDIQKTPELKN